MFAAVTPHRSLSPTGFLMVMLCSAASASLRHGVPADRRVAGVRLFRARRAPGVLWRSAPITAPRRLRGGDGDASELRVRKVSHHGRVREWTLNPLWVQLDRIGTRNSASSGCTWSRADAGCRSRPSSRRDEKASFAHALAAALGEAKRGPTRTVFD